MEAVFLSLWKTTLAGFAPIDARAAGSVDRRIEMHHIDNSFVYWLHTAGQN
jgi:hypothetical protein